MVKECTSSAELHLKVGLANTPADLRDELRNRLSSSVSNEAAGELSLRALLKELQSLADSESIIDFETIRQHLKKKSVETPVEGLMEQAEVEGLALRLANGRWMFFE